MDKKNQKYKKWTDGCSAEKLRMVFDETADKYVELLLDLWSNHVKDDPAFAPHYGWWADNDRTGIYCYDDDFFINLSDIIYCVENEVHYSEFREWQDYCTDAMEFGFDIINLKSWHLGAPRVSKDVIKNLKKMKQDLNDYAEAVKNGQIPQC